MQKTTYKTETEMYTTDEWLASCIYKDFLSRYCFSPKIINKKETKSKLKELVEVGYMYRVEVDGYYHYHLTQKGRDRAVKHYENNHNTGLVAC